MQMKNILGIWFVCFFSFLQMSFSVNSFVIVFQGSQGSSYLIEMMAQLRDICIIGYEPLGNDSGPNVMNHLRSLLYPGNMSFSAYKRKNEKLIDSPEHLNKCSGEETIYGIKARLKPLQMHTIITSPSYSKTKVIVLKRNMVKQAVGTYRRKHCGLGQFELRVKMEQQKSEKEIEEFKNRKCNVQILQLRKLLMVYWKSSVTKAPLSNYPSRVIEVSYEDIMHNITDVINNRIVPFLDSNSERKINRPPSLQKASPDFLCQSVSNFKEMCAMIKRDLPAQFLSWMNSDQCNDDHQKSYEGCCPPC